MVPETLTAAPALADAAMSNLQLALLIASTLATVLTFSIDLVKKQMGKGVTKVRVRLMALLVMSVAAMSTFAVTKVLMGMPVTEAVIAAGGAYGALIGNTLKSFAEKTRS